MFTFHIEEEGKNEGKYSSDLETNDNFSDKYFSSGNLSESNDKYF